MLERWLLTTALQGSGQGKPLSPKTLLGGTNHPATGDVWARRANSTTSVNEPSCTTLRTLPEGKGKKEG